MGEFRVLMLYPNVRVEALVPTSLALFSAILKRKGFSVDLFDTTYYDTTTKFVNVDRTKEMNLIVRPHSAHYEMRTTDGYSDFRNKVESYAPHLIAVTATESMFPMAINYLEHINDLDIPVLLGGVFATFAPAKALEFREIDMVCVGEGEWVLPEVCRKMSRGEDIANTPGLWIKGVDGSVKRNLLPPPIDPNSNPLPDLSIFEDSRHLHPRSGTVFRLFQVETHRGCPYKCTYCNSPSQDVLYKGATGHSFFRKRSFEKIREEILFVRDRYQANYIGFWADTFLAWSDREFDEFCEMYQDIRLPFWCQTRIETLTVDKVRKLKEAGIHRMDLGLEHGNDEFRRRVVKRSYSNELAVERMKILSDFAIPHTVNNIIGLPTDTRALVWDTIELNRRLSIDTCRASVYMPYWGTPLREMAVKMGYLNRETICPIDPNEPAFGMPELTIEQIKGVVRTFNLYVRFPKERWPEIAIAEKLTPEGDIKWEALVEEFKSAYYYQPDDGNEENLSESLSALKE